MKILINENAYKYILKEFRTTLHFDTRFKKRFLDEPYYDVIAKSTDGKLRKIIIGRYKIPQEVKSSVLNIIRKLQDPAYERADGILIIELHNFRITMDDVEFIGDEKQQRTYKTIFNDWKNWRIILQERPIPGDDEYNKHLSNGFYLVALIDGTEIITMFLSQTKKEEYLKNRIKSIYGRDDVKFVKNPDEELISYINPEIAKTQPVQEPTPEPQIPNEPQLSDKERRLLAYKERMKKQLRKK